MKKDKKIITNKRRSFIKKAGLLTLGAAGATAIKAPYAYSASNPIKWILNESGQISNTKASILRIAKAKVKLLQEDRSVSQIKISNPNRWYT